MSDPRDCEHGIQYTKRMHLCAQCMELRISSLECQLDIAEAVLPPVGTGRSVMRKLLYELDQLQAFKARIAELERERDEALAHVKRDCARVDAMRAERDECRAKFLSGDGSWLTETLKDATANELSNELKAERQRRERAEAALLDIKSLAGLFRGEITLGAVYDTAKRALKEDEP